MLPAQSYTRNLILSRLAADDFALLQPHLERIPLARNDELIGAGKPIRMIHFPEGGVVSIVADNREATIEVGLIGREGLVGTPVLLGSERCPERAFVQIDGTSALRIGTEPFLAAVEQSATLRTTLLRFAQVLFVQAARTAASNAASELPQRLARWLLMCHDRVDGDELPLTHEFLSMMLGVRRSGVTVTLHLLEGMHAIANRRGLISILDRAKLEDLAGDCYGVPETEYRRLLGPLASRTR